MIIPDPALTLGKYKLSASPLGSDQAALGVAVLTLIQVVALGFTSPGE